MCGWWLVAEAEAGTSGWKAPPFSNPKPRFRFESFRFFAVPYSGSVPERFSRSGSVH